MENISIWEEDVEEARRNSKGQKVTVIGFVGTVIKVKINPGKRPRRKPGQSPLDPIDPPRK
jgi:hypothetical protein